MRKQILIVVILGLSIIDKSYNDYYLKEDSVALDTSMFTKDKDDLNRRYEKCLETSYKEDLENVNGIKTAEVIIVSESEIVESIDISLIYEEDVVNASQKKEIQDKIYHYLKSDTINPEVEIRFHP